ncbi:MAG: glycosyltransferase family 2 protein [Deltaproteobacteria bacterium]|nr:glycosyltransferase family 2 protein [Deltaproteobacteria bacterium]
MKNLISIIIPLHNEEENVPVLIDRLRESLKDHPFTCEFILVDDGSKDKTFEEIKQQASKDSRVKGIRFRRNYGQTVAITAGFDLAQGDICITMDGDMQHDPEEIPEFIKKIEEGYDLVCGFRAKRNDAFLRRFPSRIANYIAKKFSGLGIRDFGSTYRAYRTSIIKQVPLYGEMHRFIPIFVGMTTDRITEIPISLNPRLHGRSKYGLARTFKVLSDLILILFFSSFFTRPIHIFGYISLTLAIPGFFIMSWLSLGKILGNLKIFDYGPLFILGILLCLVSVQLFTTGIVCEYLVRIYYMDDSRKPYHIAETTFEKP